jgi:hypothetical protein
VLAAVGVVLSNDAALATAGRPADQRGCARPGRPPGRRWQAPNTRTRRLTCPQPEIREADRPAAYDHAMGLFRSAMGLFRSRAGKDRANAAAGLPAEQTRTVTAQPAGGPREVKREARPDPDKPGWGQSIGL